MVLSIMIRYTNHQTRLSDAMSPEWWKMLKFAAQEAHRIGLTFEINISNGYVLGGKWIDKSEAMQRLVSKTLIIKKKDSRTKALLLPLASEDPDAYDVAVYAIRLKRTTARFYSFHNFQYSFFWQVKKWSNEYSCCAKWADVFCASQCRCAGGVR